MLFARRHPPPPWVWLGQDIGYLNLSQVESVQLHASTPDTPARIILTVPTSAQPAVIRCVSSRQAQSYRMIETYLARAAAYWLEDTDAK